MLLIVGKHTDRLPNISMVASRTQLQLMVAGRATSLASALAKSRRNVVLLDEADVSEELCDALSGHSEEPNLKLLVLCHAIRPTSATRTLLKRFDRVLWLTPETHHEALVDIVQKLRDEMLKVTKEELRSALTNDEFVIQYQPKVAWLADENRWQTSEAEALIRWQHPQHGLLGPRHFLPEAEQFGFMEQLSEKVLITTLNQLKRWETDGLVLAGCVNLSPMMLDLTSLAKSYRQIALEHKVDCARIIFEVPTGGVLQRGVERARVIRKLREAGFRVSLDDFGAEGNSMKAFELLEFDEIKIHASVLKDGCNDAKTLHSLAALTGLARNLDISVCAEGVETAEMFEFLQEIHCDKMQGYLVSEAVMPDIIQRHYGGEEAGLISSSGFAHLM